MANYYVPSTAYMALPESVKALDGKDVLACFLLYPRLIDTTTRNRPNAATRRDYCFLDVDRA